MSSDNLKEKENQECLNQKLSKAAFPIIDRPQTPPPIINFKSLSPKNINNSKSSPDTTKKILKPIPIKVSLPSRSPIPTLRKTIKELDKSGTTFPIPKDYRPSTRSPKALNEYNQVKDILDEMKEEFDKVNTPSLSHDSFSICKSILFNLQPKFVRALAFEKRKWHSALIKEEACLRIKVYSNLIPIELRRGQYANVLIYLNEQLKLLDQLDKMGCKSHFEDRLVFFKFVDAFIVESFKPNKAEKVYCSLVKTHSKFRELDSLVQRRAEQLQKLKPVVLILEKMKATFEKACHIKYPELR